MRRRKIRGLFLLLLAACLAAAPASGDVEPERGVCTDVVVRAYRRLGLDLQVLVHQDMTSHGDK